MFNLCLISTKFTRRVPASNIGRTATNRLAIDDTPKHYTKTEQIHYLLSGVLGIYRVIMYARIKLWCFDRLNTTPSSATYKIAWSLRQTYPCYRWCQMSCCSKNVFV